ncbi:MAG: hypothetical protein ACJ76F_07280 [Bacteroidia bacterium]
MRKVIVWYQLIGNVLSLISLYFFFIASDFNLVFAFFILLNLFSVYTCIEVIKKDKTALFMILQILQTFSFSLANFTFMYNSLLFIGPMFGLEDGNPFVSFEFHLPEFTAIYRSDPESSIISFGINIIAVAISFYLIKDYKRKRKVRAL